MKCQACGFRDDDSIQKFIHIIGTFLVEKESWRQGDSNKEQVSLYACPECKTVKLSERR